MPQPSTANIVVIQPLLHCLILLSVYLQLMVAAFRIVAPCCLLDVGGSCACIQWWPRPKKRMSLPVMLSTLINIFLVSHPSVPTCYGDQDARDEQPADPILGTRTCINRWLLFVGVLASSPPSLICQNTFEARSLHVK